MNSYLYSQMVFFSSHQEAIDALGGNVLPKDYGGMEESLEVLEKRFHQCLYRHAEWFKGPGSARLVGPLPDRLQENCEELGVDGSFRNLNVD